ncbi:MAG TPA: (Fe-S)-binding protein [Polyangiaceae bacterium]|nr:(Fe-S)-binding protein [Polyangiaceae bacterium]
MVRLPTLEPRRQQLETCVYCPKLCRTACPVSNAEPRETLIPWGKMSTAYFAARGDVPTTPSFAAPAWACTGCRACAHACDHRNDVAGTLLAARDAFVREGVEPPEARRVLSEFQAHRRRNEAALASLHPEEDAGGAALLVGCTYATKLPEVARDAIRAATKLFGRVSLVRECCGLPLLLAGDAAAFERHAREVASSLRGRETIVVDAGCAMALRVHYPEHGVAVGPVGLLVEHAAEAVQTLRGGDVRTAVRYHDPCQLGRGLGVYEAPRSVLTRALGRAPDEFVAKRDFAACSGGGGLVPVTMPAVSREIARRRVAEHEAEGGGEIVTACASSLLRFRAARSDASDIVSWIARSF